MKYLEWLKTRIPELSPKRREIFATFLLNMAIACFAVAAFEGKWWGVVPGITFVYMAFILSRGI